MMTYLVLVLFLDEWLQVHHGVQFFWRVPKQRLEITDKSVDISFPSGFMDDIFVVIISQTSRQLLVVHLWFVFPHPPSPGNLIGICEFELPPVPSPGDELLAGLVREELQEELPELNNNKVYFPK